MFGHVRAKVRQGLERDLSRLEADFEVLLVAALERCAGGEWGLFGQNDHVAEANPHLKRFVASANADDLTEMAGEIQRLRDVLGFVESFALAVRFGQYRAMRGANVPG